MKKLNDIAKIVHNELGEPPWRSVLETNRPARAAFLEVCIGDNRPGRTVSLEVCLRDNRPARTASLEICLGDQYNS